MIIFSIPDKYIGHSTEDILAIYRKAFDDIEKGLRKPIIVPSQTDWKFELLFSDIQK